MASITTSPPDRSLPLADIKSLRPARNGATAREATPALSENATTRDGTDGSSQPDATPSPGGSLPRTVALLGFFGTLLVAAALALTAHGEWRRTIETGETATARAAFFLSEHAARLFEASDLALERAKALAAARDWNAIADDRTVHDDLVRLRADLPYLDDLWLNDASGAIRQTSFMFPAPQGNALSREAFTVHADGALGDGLFAADNALMLFADGKQAVVDIKTALAES